MAEFITREDYNAGARRDPAYYVPDRWTYMSAAISMIQEAGIPIDNAIELGPYKFSIIKGADVINLRPRDCPGTTYCFDAGRQFPWPVDRHYTLLVGLQVLEHLHDKKRAFNEIRRIADHAVISVPYKWRNPGDTTHNGIDETHMLKWSGMPCITSRIVCNRLICLYDLRSPILTGVTQ